MEQRVIEKEICDKAKEWIYEYGEDFLVELIGDYVEDSTARVARLRQAAAAGDAEALTLEAHTLKSSSASLGAQSLSALAKRLEDVGRAGDLAALAEDVVRFAEQFGVVKASLEKLRSAPNAFITKER
jgi:HPt (histidine-containing phosphotransfer) domain-containing protein